MAFVHGGTEHPTQPPFKVSVKFAIVSPEPLNEGVEPSLVFVIQIVPFTVGDDKAVNVAKRIARSPDGAVQPFIPGVGMASVAGHQIGSPAAIMSAACCEPSGTLFPDESNIISLVPDGTCVEEEELLGAVRDGVGVAGP